MRNLLWFATLVALAFSGCLEDDATTNEASPGEGTDEMTAAQEGFEHSNSVPAAVSPGPLVAANTGGAWCEFGCEEIPFTVNATATAEIVLTWGMDTNDFDLVLMDAEGNEIATSGNSVGTATEQVGAKLEAGDYVIGVVPFSVVADEYTVSVTFA